MHVRFLPLSLACWVAVMVGVPPVGWAATSSRSVASPMGGNGYGLTFDGRLFLVRRGGVPDGWFATLFRPDRVATVDGFPDMQQGAFSAFRHVQPVQFGENAMAICEPDADHTPFRCNAASVADPAGAYTCYDLFILESNAEANQDNSLHRRRILVRTDPPDHPDAQVLDHQWLGGRELLDTRLRGIEPTVTRDGSLLIYQGHPQNNGEIDVLMYTYNPSPCAVTGWSAPRSISAMHADTTVRSRYRLGERQLRAADGTPFAENALFRGAYPWVFPAGDAVFFAATNLPCRATEDPPGCGPRRGALSVVGYPTNWGLAHIDGAINPDTDQTVRLFFNSPGPHAFPQLPRTPGTDVWPMFGSNTSNYAEVVLDDGLDGNLAGLWHFNESVNVQGQLDRTRTPDSSGYFHTGVLSGGANLPLRNNGAVGKAVEFNGQGARVTVQNSTALNPVNAITVDLMLFPLAPVDCDGNNNYRVILQKGNNFDLGLSLVLEEDLSLQARVAAGGASRAIRSAAVLPLQQWSHIAFTYDAATGDMAFFVNGTETQRLTGAPATLMQNTDPLFVGGPPGTTAGCPNLHGAFHGLMDELRISRVLRYGITPPPSSSSSSLSAPSSAAAPSSSDTAVASSDMGVPSSVATSQPAGTSSSLWDASSASAPRVSSSSGAVTPSSMGTSASASSQTGVPSSVGNSSGGAATSAARSSGASSQGANAGEGDGGTATGCADARVGAQPPLGWLVGVGLAGCVRSRRRRSRH